MSIAFSLPDEKYFASGSRDGTIRIYDGEVTSIAYSPDGKRLISGHPYDTVRIWKSSTYQLLTTLRSRSRGVTSRVYSFDGLRIVSGFFDRTILVWDAESGEIAGEPITGHGDCVKSVCISPCGKRIVSGSQGGTARV